MKCGEIALGLTHRSGMRERETAASAQTLVYLPVWVITEICGQ